MMYLHIHMILLAQVSSVSLLKPQFLSSPKNLLNFTYLLYLLYLKNSTTSLFPDGVCLWIIKYSISNFTVKCVDYPEEWGHSFWKKMLLLIFLN